MNEAEFGISEFIFRNIDQLKRKLLNSNTEQKADIYRKRIQTWENSLSLIKAK